MNLIRDGPKSTIESQRRAFPCEPRSNLPDSVYRRTEQAARERGISVDDLISGVPERELAEEALSPPAEGYVSPPMIHSKNPGTLDLSGVDVDDLLA